MSDEVKRIKNVIGEMLLKCDAQISRTVIDEIWVDTTKVYLERFGVSKIAETINSLVINKCACRDCIASTVATMRDMESDQKEPKPSNTPPTSSKDMN